MEGQQQPQQEFQGQQQTGQPQYYSPQFPPSDNLDTLSVLHIVKGVLTLLVSFFFLFYAFMGHLFQSIIETQEQADMPFNVSYIFMFVGIIGFVITVVIGILTLLAAKYIRQRRNYTFVFAMSIVNCLSGILGILLGIFTIIDINKPHVKAQFDQNNNH